MFGGVGFRGRFAVLAVSFVRVLVALPAFARRFGRWFGGVWCRGRFAVLAFRLPPRGVAALCLSRRAAAGGGPPPSRPFAAARSDCAARRRRGPPPPPVFGRAALPSSCPSLLLPLFVLFSCPSSFSFSSFLLPSFKKIKKKGVNSYRIQQHHDVHDEPKEWDEPSH